MRINNVILFFLYSVIFSLALNNSGAISAETLSNNDQSMMSIDIDSGTYFCPQIVHMSYTKSDTAIYYTIDGTEPTIDSNKYIIPFRINNSCKLRARTIRSPNIMGPIIERDISIKEAIGKRAIKINNDILVIAHRGYSSNYPENTIIAFEKAWDAGADICELDVSFSSDKKIMVLHDPDTRRVTLGKVNYKIAQTPSDILRTVDVGIWRGSDFANQKIPFLQEVLAKVPYGKGLFIEIKVDTRDPINTGFIKELQRIIKEYSFVDVSFLSFNLNTLNDIKAAFPSIPAYFVPDKRPNSQLLRRIQEDGLDGVSYNNELPMSNEAKEKFSREGLKFWVWNVNEVSSLSGLNELSVDGIYSDNPQKLINYRN